GWGPGGWIWIAWMILFWGGLLAAAVYLIRRQHGPAATGPAGTGPGGTIPGGTGPGGTIPAETVLAERYARGEIDTDEYQRRLATLREHRDQGPGS
ncbi:MAG: SHOCT domain-containing protein, partial [Actinobacteria bacterium]|nr:SHOCT domain-containing protein [Actinomycetota bacterium]